MLTIQPNLAHKVYTNPSFKSREDFDVDEARYNEEKDFYEGQINDFDEVINDDYMPQSMKKAAKVLKIVSEGILSGWAMAWATTKGARVFKTSAMRAINSNTYKKTAEIFKPLKDGAKGVAKNIKELGKSKIKAFAEKESVKNFLENKEAGKFITKQYKKTSQKLAEMKTSFENHKKNITYEAVTRYISGIFGVGTGAMTAYNAAAKDRASYNDEYAEAV